MMMTYGAVMVPCFDIMTLWWACVDADSMVLYYGVIGRCSDVIVVL